MIVATLLEVEPFPGMHEFNLVPSWPPKTCPACQPWGVSRARHSF